VRPTIGKKRAQDVTRRDLEGILAAMVTAGAPVSANRLLAALKPFFAWVRINGDPLPSLPTTGVDKPVSEEGRDRDRVLTDAEIGWLWAATHDDTAFSAAVRLMLLTGQRRGEVSGMVDAELSLDGDEPSWLIPAARTKNGRENLVPLAPAAVAAILRPPHIGRSRLVLTSAIGTQLSGWSKCKAALDARIFAIATQCTGRPPNIEPWVLHDLRRTAATGLARLGEQVHIIEAVLNHKTGAISRLAGIYNRHGYEAEKRRALSRWAQHISVLAERCDERN
jgi:integrase